MKRISRAKLVEDFKIFVNSLYEHQSVKDNQKFVDELDKEAKKIGGNLKAVVRVTTYLPNKIQESKMYDIEEAAYNGVEIKEDAEAFEVRVDMLSSVKNENTYSSNLITPFKSMLFIISENAKIFEHINAPRGIRIVKNMALYSAKTGDKIRFGEENKLEL